MNPAEDPRIKHLLERYSDRRDKVEAYIGDMEELKDQVSALFPKQLDHRAKYILEEKIKASASFYQTLLSLTMEFNKSIVQEIDIIRKLSMGTDGKERDVREIVEWLEKHNPDVVEGMQIEPEEQITEPTQVTEIQEE